MHRIAVVGTGYVGLVTGACLADFGNRVVCVDVDKGKIDQLRNSHVPFFEPGLEELVRRNIQEERLSFTTDLHTGVRDTAAVFIAVLALFRAFRIVSSGAPPAGLRLPRAESLGWKAANPRGPFWKL